MGLDFKPLFFILVLVALLLTPGCLEGNNTITPPFTTGQFVNKATDLNYTDWKNGDYNNMVLVFDGNKISVADANDLNVVLPDLTGFVPYQGAIKDVNLGVHSFSAYDGNFFNLNLFNTSVTGSSSLVAHYKLNETTGTTVDDSSNGNDGVANTDASNLTVAGKIVNAFQFNGSSEMVTVPNSDNLKPGLDDFSVAFWINPQGYGADNSWKGFIDMRAWAASTENGWSIGVGTRGDFPDYHKVTTHFTDASSGWDMVSDGTNCSASDIVLDEWHHWVVVFARSEGKVKFYLDGALDAEWSPTGGYPTLGVEPTMTMLIGNDHRNGWTPTIFDDIRIYREALGLSDAQTLYNSGDGTEDAPASSLVTVYDNISLDANKNILFGSSGIFDGNVSANNFIGNDLNLSGNVYQDGNFFGNQIYGELNGVDINAPIEVVSTYTNLSDVNVGFLNGFSLVDKNLVAGYSGKYSVVSQWSFSGFPNSEYHLSLFRDNIQYRKCHAERKMGAGGDVGSASFTCIVDLNVGSYLNVKIENVSTSNSAMIHDFQLVITRIGN